jgi:metal-responsive CopG/Arc/MetJ family transcriptional regulator
MAMLMPGEVRMKTVQMTLDEQLLQQVDEAVARLGTTRSAFARDALRRTLEALRRHDMEKAHRRGYERFPVRPGELGDWEGEQAWGDC